MPKNSKYWDSNHYNATDMYIHVFYQLFWHQLFLKLTRLCLLCKDPKCKIIKEKGELYAPSSWFKKYIEVFITKPVENTLLLIFYNSRHLIISLLNVATCTCTFGWFLNKKKFERVTKGNNLIQISIQNSLKLYLSLLNWTTLNISSISSWMVCD